jgi:branched-subunit amino acid transport protein
VNVGWLILAMGAGVYSLRLAGLVLPDGAVRAVGDRALGLVPIALLTALVVASLGVGAEGVGVRLVAAAGGALVAYRTGQMWACIVAGMLLYGLLALGQ